MGGVQSRDRARPRPGGRRLLQAREHRVQAEQPRARGPIVAQGARDQPEARARQSQSGHVERAVVTSEQDERAFRALTRKVTRARGLACDSYKDRCLRRRIAVRMRARGVHTFDDYARLLDQDAHEYDLLLDALTINVTKFFRNIETWRALEPWLDGLWRARRGDVRVWSAGCASGEEPYTVAVALAEAARRLGQASLFPRARVDATDIDRTSLERTEAAEYAEPAFTEMPPELVHRYFTAQSPRHPLPELRRIVRVLKHDLTTEPPPAPPYDLIVCRNVVIYFDRPMQERLFSLFAEALAPGGMLLLGKVETLFGPARERLVLEEPRERIYRRAGA
ncbi:MAG: chemotaxis protein CheR [Gemmatimonadetes bacterium]|nr:MAG: chemotaxis protein CheR [Gemmatimonadota bacterium]